LLISLSQFIPALKVGNHSNLKNKKNYIGFMFTYFSPLCFVLFVTLMKEGWDDLQRYRRDKEINNNEYE
jgi:phospholipid-translocating ATPase